MPGVYRNPSRRNVQERFQCRRRLSCAAFSGVRPNGDYWVFLEVSEAAMGGLPESDGTDTVEELMRNNPLEDLEMHLPLICDRYEVRDDVAPGAGKFRAGA